MDGSIVFPMPSPVQFLNEKGHLVAGSRPTPEFVYDEEEISALYNNMVFTRLFDAKAVNLQRTGRLGTFASSKGQEAVGTGIASAMKCDDIFIGSYREQSALFWLGVLPEEILLYWGGDERGSNFANAKNVFPISVPIATHLPHAAGAAYAEKLRGGTGAVVGVCGDGGSSKPDFGSALNFAGVHKLPVVFVVVNNGWAISVPRAKQTAAETIAQKALAYGVRGIRVDGNDVIAVRAVVEEALSQARAGGGSTLVEAVTYRLSDHTTADDAARYRTQDEVQRAEEREPIRRLRAAFMKSKALGGELEADKFIWSVEEACRARIERAVSEYESRIKDSPQNPESMFQYLYAELPHTLKSQRRELLSLSASENI